MRRAVGAGCAWGVGALACGIAAIAIAVHHPLSPEVATGAVLAWFVAAWRWPGLWLFMLPALLPTANLSPWTGWIVVEEFDLLVLGAVAAGYGRFGWNAGVGPSRYHDSAPESAPAHRGTQVLVTALVALTLFGLWRGWADNDVRTFNWFDGYTDPLNSLRVGKSALFALLLLPMLSSQLQADASASMRRLAYGMLCGAGIVSLAVMTERAAYPGLFNFTEPYRTTAWFWEMHVGGAAIDVYVAVATPFIAWALWHARSRWQWAAAAGFALVWCYVCLTTFSRGVYLAVALSGVLLLVLLPVSGSRRRRLARHAVLVVGAAALLWLAVDRIGYSGGCMILLLAIGSVWLLRRRRGPQTAWRGLAGASLSLALVFEIVGVLGADSFMTSRVERSQHDYSSRLGHWSRGVGLLQTSGEWLWGLGAGRLPANYDQFVLGGQFSGRVRLLQAGEDRAVEVKGPESLPRLGGLHGLTQSVPLRSAYRVLFTARTSRTTNLWVRVCETHLLYDYACHSATVTIEGTQTWSRVQLTLAGPPLTGGEGLVPRRGVFALSVLNAGGRVELDNMALESGDDSALLRNGDFTKRLAHWLPVAQYHFLPWHIDNLYLELLIERGLLGLSVFVVMSAMGLRRLLRLRAHAWAPFVTASLCAAFCVGLVSSVLDVPRTALIFWLLLAVSLRIPGAESQPSARVL
jgi:hypothetical protein